MFNFHRPKTYRSIQGCCICGAKSSSSRFTDSKRYENDFTKCFRIMEHRSGEICNACVLLVKRWKKLPAGTNRDWNHVVDARAGPGSKAMKHKNITKSAKIAKLKKEKKRLKKKRRERERQRQINVPSSPGGLSDDFLVGEEAHSENSGPPSLRPYSRSPTPHSESEDTGDEEFSGNRHHTELTKVSSFLDLKYWKITRVCCGIIFKGSNNDVMIDPALLKPCAGCREQKTKQRLQQDSKTDAAEKNDVEDDVEEEDEEEKHPMPKLRAEIPYRPTGFSHIDVPLDLSYKASPAFCQSTPMQVEV